MTVDEARELLARLGYTPGQNATSEPRFCEHRDEIKAACAALKRAGADLQPPRQED